MGRIDPVACIGVSGRGNGNVLNVKPPAMRARDEFARMRSILRAPLMIPQASLPDLLIGALHGIAHHQKVIVVQQLLYAAGIQRYDRVHQIAYGVVGGERIV